MRFVIVITAALAWRASGAVPCASLATLKLDNTTITAAEFVPAGVYVPPGEQPIRNLPAFCRVSGLIQPASDSRIPLEVWMPSSGWNGKFQGVGNGGYAGSIAWTSLAAAVIQGYSSAATDTGHSGGATDAAWALGHPQKVIDFGYRGIHETAEKAKAIVAAFYGEGPKRSYFNGCSNGGRQALMEAQRYPADYDGIIAGAPANYWTHLLTEAVWDTQALLNDPASYIPASKLPAIEAAALAACDSLDGVKDGVIDDPARCHFDPSTLLCKGAESASCLTSAQITTLKKLYGGPLDSKGAPVFFGHAVGGETGRGGWGLWVTGPAPEKSLSYAFGTQFFKNMVFENTQWDFHTFHVTPDVKGADDKLARILNATDPDLKRFQQRGGKLILYHGWSDAAIPPFSAIDYYQGVVKKMGAKDAGGFVRLYMAPGMQHCGGGPGPSSFGQAIEARSDPRGMTEALEQWVEQGSAPGRIIAAKLQDGTVVRTRPLCAYPQVARWNGSGSADDAANFSCAAPR